MLRCSDIDDRCQKLPEKYQIHASQMSLSVARHYMSQSSYLELILPQ